VPYQPEAEAVEQAFRLVDLCMKGLPTGGVAAGQPAAGAGQGGAGQATRARPEPKVLAIANTFVSEQTSENQPKKDCVELIIEGAKENDLPETFIQKVMESSNYSTL
jgi:hypothetical protein